MNIDFDAFFARMPLPCMILDQNLRFVAANDAYCEMVGKPADDLIARYVFDVFPESDERVAHMTKLFREVLAGRDMTFSEIPFHIEQDGRRREHWWTAHHISLSDADAGQTYLMQFSENVTETVRARTMRDALMAEMQHRVGNILAIVGAIARQTSRTADTVPDFLKSFTNRLQSLVKVNRRLVGDAAEGEDMRDVISHGLTVQSDEVQGRISLDGPPYPLSMHQSQAVSMAIHELSTNAMKYGALDRDAGRVAISWSLLPDDGCVLRWEETGSTWRDESERVGYGTTLLHQIIPDQLGGTAQRTTDGDALVYTLTIGGGDS